MSGKRKRGNSAELQSDSPSEIPGQEALIRETISTTPNALIEPSTSPQTPSSTDTGEPLTKANLRILERSLIVSGMPPKRTNDGAPSSAPPSIAGSMLPNAKTLEDLIVVLNCNNFKIDDEKAKQLCPEVIQFGAKLVRRTRHSDMDETSQQLALKDQNFYAWGNENTFVIEMWRYMHRDYRDVRTSGDHGSAIVDTDWTTEAWAVANLGARWNRDFRPESIPLLETSDPTVIKMLNALPRVSNPRPDLTYGIREEAFTDRQKNVRATHIRFAEVCPGICFPFFAAEFKGSGGTMSEAIIQACRCGAALVIGVRELLKLAELDRKEPGADTDSFAFTLAMTTTEAHMYVHWAEVILGMPAKYHMHRLRIYSLLKGEDYAEIRRDLNNILDWGLTERLSDAQRILNAIDAKNFTPPSKADLVAPSGPSSKKRKGEKGASASSEGGDEAEKGDMQMMDERVD